MPATNIFLSSSSESLASLDCTNATEFVHDAESKPEMVPYVGQLFSRLEEAENFYRSYAQKNGFEIRIATSHKHVRSDEYSSRLFVCKKAGRSYAVKSSQDDECGNDKIRRQRDAIGRTLCKARMFVVHNKKEGNWRISTIELDHNHHLVTPTKVDLIETYRNITPVARQLIDTLNKAGIGPSRMMNVLSTMGGGMQTVGFTDKDIRNVVRDLRRDSEDENDAQAAVNYLKNVESASVSKFFFRVKACEDNRITCILWVDARSRLMYQHFGDVVTFDSTYRTNRYNMPFVPFTGVNHHYQSILFGFALLRDETEETFVWVLETWLEAMDYRTPTTIITDQDKAMSNAIARVLPSTNHVLCSWHISNKFPEKLHHVYSEHPSFKEDFNNCVYNSLSIGEFEERWEILMRDYDLYKNEWLISLYDVKEKWIRVYTKRFFSAGMTTTGRSEGMNHFFDEYLNASTGMKEFVVKTQMAVEKQFMRERKADYVTKHRKRSLVCGSSLEVHAAECYTKEMFRRFQKELVDSLKYNIQKVRELCVIDTKVYAVYKADTTFGDTRRYREVVSNRQLGSVTCTCQMFSHSGQICRHILRYYSFKSISKIPDDMILRRWTRDANKSNGEQAMVSPINADFEQNQAMRYNHLMSDYQELATKAACSVRGYKTVLQLNARGKALVDQYDPDDNFTDIPDDDIDRAVADAPDQMGLEDDDEEEDVVADGEDFLPPKASQTKGRKKQMRFKSALEKLVRTKPHRKCAICGFETNHDKRNHYKVLGIPEPK